MEDFSTIVLSSFGDRSPEAVQEARVLCLLCEAIYTHWLQTICVDTVHNLRMCPWPIENILYRGACRESPLSSSSTLHHTRIPKLRKRAVSPRINIRNLDSRMLPRHIRRYCIRRGIKLMGYRRTREEKSSES